MVEPKLSLTLVLPGSTMVSQQVAENKPEENYEQHSFTLREFNKKSKKYFTKTYNYSIRKSIPAKQVWKMSQKAYKAMLETPTSPKYSKIVAKSKGKLIRVWDTMSEENRIRKHCELIAHDKGAIDFSFYIFGD